MTVIRGDAARRLMARSRATAHDPGPRPAAQPWTASMISPSGLGAARTTAAFVGNELTAHGLRDRLPDATAVVTELVENAIRHGRGTARTSIRVAVDGRITLEVTDQAPVTPALRAAANRGELQEGGGTAGSSASPPGTGLKLVALLARAWGIREDPAGKAVWAQLHDHDVHCRGCHQL